MAFNFLEWMETFAMQYGYFGVFFMSLVGSLSIIVPIPYTILIYIMGATLDPILVAIASGFGSAVGEFSGYALGYYGRAVISEERQRKMDFMVKVFDRYGFFAIFFFALTPLPDDLLFIPLGIMRYKFVKAFVPSFMGKLLMSFILALSGRLSIEFIHQLLGEGGWIGAIITTIFLIIIIVAILKIDWEKVFEKYVGEQKLESDRRPSHS
jgi:membrane protein DedA with SNARE-associated domain